MKLSQTNKHKWNYLALAFALPFISFLMIMICGGYEPFGNNRSMLYSDMYHQYYPFFVNFHKMLRSGDSILYNWDIGMGLDYVGLFSYYLSSPLNLISILLPHSLLLEYFSLLVPLKLSFASLFFAIFLKNVFHQNDLSITLFGAFYGLCAWALGYQWNVMWLDTFALLPLVVLGTIALLRDRKFVLYTVTLFLSVFSNYYIGFFTCIFVLLFFFCYELCRCQSFSRFFSDLCTIALFSILAIGMTAILELPTLAALQNSYSSVNKFPDSFRLNIASEHTWKGLLDAMRQVAGNMGGGLEPTFKEGLPNLYCGVGSVMMAFLYLICRNIKLRDKFCCVILLLFFNVSFIIRQLDYIWHGFHFTNMIPYRFSFLYSMVILYMAYKAWLLRENFKLWQVIAACVFALAVFLCSDSRTDAVFIAYNLVFLLLYLAVFLYPLLLKRPKDPDKLQSAAYRQALSVRHSVAALALAGVMVIEIIMNVVNFGIAFPYTGISSYPKGNENSTDVLAYMKDAETDNLFYRAEVTHSQTLNDGALNGYHGISTFTSSANVKVTTFMKALGYGAKESYNRYCYEESSPISNLFLGIKYMIERDGNLEENHYFTPICTSGNVTLLENNAYLPLGFMAQVQLANVDFSDSGDAFSFQNELLSAASGITDPAWFILGKNALTITSGDVDVSLSSSVGYCTYHAESAGTVTYTIVAERSGLMCIDLNLPKRNGLTVKRNGTTLFKETYSIPQTMAVSHVEPGDVIEIDLSCKAGEKSNMTVQPAILDDSVFQAAYDILNTSTLELTEFSNTRVTGTISCENDGLLYTSIPQNGNWNVSVDGKEADTVLVGDCMVGVPLAEGDHTVTFVYRNKAFSIGWKISLLCLLLFISITAAIYSPHRRKGKYEK